MRHGLRGKREKGRAEACGAFFPKKRKKKPPSLQKFARRQDNEKGKREKEKENQGTASRNGSHLTVVLRGGGGKKGKKEKGETFLFLPGRREGGKTARGPFPCHPELFLGGGKKGGGEQAILPVLEGERGGEPDFEMFAEGKKKKSALAPQEKKKRSPADKKRDRRPGNHQREKKKGGQGGDPAASRKRGRGEGKMVRRFPSRKGGGEGRQESPLNTNKKRRAASQWVPIEKKENFDQHRQGGKKGKNRHLSSGGRARGKKNTKKRSWWPSKGKRGALVPGGEGGRKNCSCQSKDWGGGGGKERKEGSGEKDIHLDYLLEKEKKGEPFLEPGKGGKEKGPFFWKKLGRKKKSKGKEKVSCSS